MDITTTEHTRDATRYVVISLRGRVDAFHAATLRERIDTLTAEKVKYFVLDLSYVEFLDSAGLAALVSLLKRTQQEGGAVKMILPQAEAARRILRLTRFDKVFSIHESTEDALKSF